MMRRILEDGSKESMLKRIMMSLMMLIYQEMKIKMKMMRMRKMMKILKKMVNKEMNRGIMKMKIKKGKNLKMMNESCKYFIYFK